MAAQLGNYVLETATSPGTGGFTLNGAEANRRAFSTAFPNGGNVLYFADDGSQAEWGIGTLTVGKPSTLARSTVLGNTAGTKVALNFPGSVEVYNEIPAEMVPVLEQDGSLALAGNLTVKGKTLVQDVDDFSSQEAVPAKQADGRYVLRGQGLRGVDSAATSLWMDLTTEGSNLPRLGIRAANGATYGVYGAEKVSALISNASAEADKNTQKSVSALDNSKLSKSGGQVDWLRVAGDLRVFGNMCAVWNGIPNAWVNTYVDNGGNATWDLNGGSPDHNTGNRSWLRMAPDGHLWTGRGNVAFQSDLPSLPGGTLLTWTVDNVASMSTQNLPRAFRSPPVVWCQDISAVNVHYACIRNVTTTNFQVQTGSNATIPTLRFFAMGDPA